MLESDVRNMRRFSERLLQAASLLAHLLLAGLTSCMSGVIELPSAATRFVPPSVYVTWWHIVENCSGSVRDFGEVEWYSVPGSSLSIPGSDASGVFTSDALGHRILLTAGSREDGGVVRHEMLHALLLLRGHPRSAFLGTCAGVVSCAVECVRDAGAPSPLDVPMLVVRSSSLLVSNRLEPAVPSAFVDSGHFRLVVSARNQSGTAVRVVDADPVRSSPDRVAFWYEMTDSVGRVIGGAASRDDSRIIFAPGETKVQIFDFVIGNDPAGARPYPRIYSFRGRYGEQFGDSIVVDLSR